MKNENVFDIYSIDILSMYDSPKLHKINYEKSFFKGEQYGGLKYDWDGYLDGWTDGAQIYPGATVSYKLRKPSVKTELAKTIVKKLTAFMFGKAQFPYITTEQEFVNYIIEKTKLEKKIKLIRNIGGACGSVYIVLGFSKGLPRITPFTSEQFEVLEWEDEYNLIPKVAVNFTKEEKRVFNKQANVYEDKEFYSIRFYFENETHFYNNLTKEQLKRKDYGQPEIEIHNFGICPVIYVQNIEDEDSDGESDYSDVKSIICTIDGLHSSTSRGLYVNLDPTLVIKDAPFGGESVIKKGEGNAIYSPGGAQYLELDGSSTQTALTYIDKLVTYVELNTGVLLHDTINITSKATSAAALKVIYSQMISSCNALRAQYGDAIKCIIERFKTIYDNISNCELETSFDGEVPKELDYTLEWPEYFEPQESDIKLTVDSALAAQGKIISDETAINHVREIFNISDIDDELEKINEQITAKSEMFPSPEMKVEPLSDNNERKIETIE